MVGILQGKARGGEEESILMHDLKPFRILISLLDKPELGMSICKHQQCNYCPNYVMIMMHMAHSRLLSYVVTHPCCLSVSFQVQQS